MVGGNFNRTVPEWRTDPEFGDDATDDHRWLDTLLHALILRRADTKPDLLWYHFCAHPVCYRDENVGPDWPGIVVEHCRRIRGLVPVFLQGHIGDVNPGADAGFRCSLVHSRGDSGLFENSSNLISSLTV